MAKGKRSVFHSILTKDGWAVMLDKAASSLHDTQKDAEREAISLAKKVHSGGGLSQVVFHKADGVIREERTYGKDPEKTPG